MDKVNVKVITENNMPIPTYGSSMAAGADIRAAERVLINPGQTVLVKTGIKVAIPEGYVGIIKDRSGLAYKYGIKSMAGVIDPDYRGEIGVVLHNTSDELFRVVAGHRIAQLLIIPAVQAEFTPVDSLDDTERGEGGFGSTGVK